MTGEHQREVRLKVIDLGRTDRVNAAKAKELVHAIEYSVRNVPDEMLRTFLVAAIDFYWGGVIDPIEGVTDETRRQDG